jgi:hypothetical protein
MSTNENIEWKLINAKFPQFKKYLKNNFFTFEQYEKVALNNLKIIKKERKKKKLTKKDEHYAQFICDSLFKIDTNISELSKGLKLMFTKKNLMPSVFLLRGLTELIFFNIYVAFKSYLYIKKNNLKGLVDLICRSSLASDLDTINSEALINDSAILSKIIKKYKGRRIHINDCIRFYKKGVFNKIIKTKESKKIRSFYKLEAHKDFNNLREKLTEKEIKQLDGLLNEDTELIVSIYDRMCEIIHPTAIIINDAKERKTQIDYREIFGAIGGSHFHWINLHAIFYKIFLCDWFLENKDEFIKTFNERINNK